MCQNFSWRMTKWTECGEKKTDWKEFFELKEIIIPFSSLSQSHSSSSSFLMICYICNTYCWVEFNSITDFHFGQVIMVKRISNRHIKAPSPCTQKEMSIWFVFFKRKFIYKFDLQQISFIHSYRSNERFYLSLALSFTCFFASLMMAAAAATAVSNINNNQTPMVTCIIKYNLRKINIKENDFVFLTHSAMVTITSTE